MIYLNSLYIAKATKKQKDKQKDQQITLVKEGLALIKQIRSNNRALKL